METKKEPKPFFAKFLEGMDQKGLNDVKAGGDPTLKYPSDRDEVVY